MISIYIIHFHSLSKQNAHNQSSLLQLWYNTPIIRLIRENLQLLPVNCIHCPCGLFIYCGHLEREDFLDGRSCLSQTLLNRVKYISILQKPATETSKDKQFLIIHLGNSQSLSASKAFSCVLDHLPVLLWRVIIFFNRVNIFLSCIRNATEYVDKFILEWTTSMVMSAFIQRRNFKPDVQVNIILLTFQMSSVILLPWSSYNDELFW